MVPSESLLVLASTETSSGLKPLVGEALKSATGGRLAGITDNVAA